MQWKTITRSKWAMLALGILGCMVAFVIAAFVLGVPYVSWRSIVAALPIIAVAGAYYGTIFMLDGRSGNPSSDYPAWRTLACGVLAGLGTILWQGWPPSGNGWRWVAIAACIGALLGWIGWKWAKYVDF